MRHVTLALVLLTTLAGCQLTNVEGEIDDVRVSVGTNDHHDRHRSNGGFCPPGQAKKGNC
ncbi:lipoprotein [Vibrio sp. FJH11]